MRPQPLLAAAILVGLVAAARGDERRQEWKTTRKRDGKVLVMVSNILERASSEFLIELVPEGQLYGTWRQREDQRLTLQLCDPIEGQCVRAATPLGPEGRPPMMRIEGPSMGFWVFRADGDTETTRLNSRLVLSTLAKAFGTKLAALARDSLTDPRMSRLQPLLQILETGEVMPLDADSLSYGAWTSSDAWRQRFIRARGIESDGCVECTLFEEAPYDFFEPYRQREMLRLGIGKPASGGTR